MSEATMSLLSWIALGVAVAVFVVLVVGARFSRHPAESPTVFDVLNTPPDLHVWRPTRAYIDNEDDPAYSVVTAYGTHWPVDLDPGDAVHRLIWMNMVCGRLVMRIMEVQVRVGETPVWYATDDLTVRRRYKVEA